MSVFHNNALIGAGGGAGAADAAVATKSLRFKSGDSAYLNRTPSSAGNRKTFTFSAWVKKTEIISSGDRQIFGSDSSGGSEFNGVAFISTNALNFRFNDSGSLQLRSSALHRDPSAWLHIVCAADTSQATASDRLKMYVNGAEVTDFSSSTYPSQNAESSINSTQVHEIGRRAEDGGQYFNGYLADIHFIDGSALTPSSFGAYDDNGVWQAAVYSGTYGTNGFHLDFADAADLGDDNSGNGNDFTVNNLTGHATVQTYPGVAFDGPTNGASIATGYLSIPASNSSDFNFGTGDFTWEGFFLSYDWTGGSSNDDQQVLVHHPTGSSDISGLFVDGGQSYYYSNKASSRFIITGPTLEDGRWYHIAASRESGTLRFFVDGVSAGSASYTDDYADGIFTLGRNEDNDKNQFRGVISNFRVLKGTALYTSNFTVPTTPLTNITNTKLLCCQSSSSATTAAVSPGTIVANGDTNGTERSDSRASNDSLFDVPTNGDQTDSGAGGEVSGNYCCWNPLAKGSNMVLENGNLDIATTTGKSAVLGTIGMSSGKWYWETTINGSNDRTMVGIGKQGIDLSDAPGQGDALGWGYYADGGNKFNGGTSTSYGAGFTDGGAVIGCAFDADNGTLTFYKNGVSQGTAFTGLTDGPYFPANGDGSSVNNADSSVNFGQRAWVYSAPSNHKALCTTNLPTPTIADGSDYFDTSLWTGNGSTQSITGLEFSPDLVWIKMRSAAAGHRLYDAVRGATKFLVPQGTDAEATQSAGLTSFDSAGFSLGSNFDHNNNSSTFVGWAWDGGSLATNSAYNQADVWSDRLSGTVLSSSLGYKNAFDGDTSTATHPANGNTITFTPSTAISVSSSIKIYFQIGSITGISGTADITINGTSYVSNANAGRSNGHFTVTGVSSITSITWERAADNDLVVVTAIEVDSKKLVDAGVIPVGSLNSSAYNQSQTWSTYGSVTAGAFSPTIAALFDNDVSTGPSTGANTTATWTFTAAVTATSSIHIYVVNGSGPSGTQASNTEIRLTVDGVVHAIDGAPGLINTGLTGDLTAITINVGQSGSPGLRYIKIDDKELVDSGITVANVPTIASTVRANSSAGFSIVTFTNTTSNSTVGHGLNAKPDMIIWKKTSGTSHWPIYHSALGATKYVYLNLTNAASTGSEFWNNTEPTSSAITTKGEPNSMGSAGDTVMYVFTAVAGYSAFGSYDATGTSDGPFQFTGFQVKWLMVKGVGYTSNWNIFDIARDTDNPAILQLRANLSSAEQSNTSGNSAILIDLLSNGFKLRAGAGSANDVNQSSQSYIWAAFAENPFSSNGGLAR